MQTDFLKNLVALLAQAGGNVTLSLPDLRAIGLELTLTNISSDTQGSITLRLGAKIYYVPAAGAVTAKPEKEQQWQGQAQEKTSNGSSGVATEESGTSPATPQQRQAERLQNRISEEIGAINQINNRPPQPQPVPNTRRRQRQAASSSNILPPSPVGVYQTSDLSSYLREREVADAREWYQHRQERRNRPGAEEGVMPFRVMDSPPKPEPQE